MATVNIAENYVDIAMTNPTRKVTAYQFTMHGINILGVQNMVNPLIYPINPEYIPGGQEVIGISYQGFVTDKYLVPSPLCRIYFSEITDTIICIEKITDIVNENYERTNTRINGDCFKVPTTGVNEALFNVDVKVYPNPSNDNFNLQITTPKAIDIRIGLYDMLGQQVRSITSNGRSSQLIPIDMNGLNAGIYTLSIISGKGQTTQRLVYMGK